MRLHSDTLTRDDVYNATHAAQMTGVKADATQHGSRSKARAFEVHLTGTSFRRPNSGGWGATTDDDTHAATWDEWGMFLNYLYSIDPNMIVGSPGRPTYADLYDFDATTTSRFMFLEASEQHRNHKWIPLGARVFECKCGAVQDQSYTYNKREH